jgi:hypothetical protein
MLPLPRAMTVSNHAVIALEPSRLQEYLSYSFKPSASPPAPVPAHFKIRGTFKTSSSFQVYNIQAPQVFEPLDCFKMSHCTPPTPSTPLVLYSGRGMSMSSPPRETKVCYDFFTSALDTEFCRAIGPRVPSDHLPSIHPPSPSTLAMPTPFFLRLVSTTGLRDVFQCLTPCAAYPRKLRDYCEAAGQCNLAQAPRSLTPPSISVCTLNFGL